SASGGAELDLPHRLAYVGRRTAGRGHRRRGVRARGAGGDGLRRRHLLRPLPPEAGGPPPHPGVHQPLLHAARQRRDHGNFGRRAQGRRGRGDAGPPLLLHPLRVPRLVRHRADDDGGRRLPREPDARAGAEDRQGARLMAAFEPVLTRNVFRPEVLTFAGYRQRGGYEGLAKALKMEPDAVIDEVKKSGLRGRGGGGLPPGLKWSFIPKGKDKPKYLVCNADESEPGTFKDRLLMERDPHQLIEGCAICCWAVQASTCYVYIRGEYVKSAEILERAIREAYEQGVLGDSVLGSGFKLDMWIHRGAGAYICGEETGMLESLEGKRGQPRVKPPFP